MKLLEHQLQTQYGAVSQFQLNMQQATLSLPVVSMTTSSQPTEIATTMRDLSQLRFALRMSSGLC